MIPSETCFPPIREAGYEPNAQLGLGFSAKFQATAWWSRLAAALPLSDRHAGLHRMSLSESFADDRAVFSKLFRLLVVSSIYFFPNQVILDRLRRYAQIIFSQDSEEFFLS
jgi:hypothetical protein